MTTRTGRMCSPNILHRREKYTVDAGRDAPAPPAPCRPRYAPAPPDVATTLKELLELLELLSSTDTCTGIGAVVSMTRRVPGCTDLKDTFMVPTGKAIVPLAGTDLHTPSLWSWTWYCKRLSVPCKSDTLTSGDLSTAPWSRMVSPATKTGP